MVKKKLTIIVIVQVLATIAASNAINANNSKTAELTTVKTTTAAAEKTTITIVSNAVAAVTTAKSAAITATRKECQLNRNVPLNYIEKNCYCSSEKYVVSGNYCLTADLDYYDNCWLNEQCYSNGLYCMNGNNDELTELPADKLTSIKQMLESAGKCQCQANLIYHNDHHTCKQSLFGLRCRKQSDCMYETARSVKTIENETAADLKCFKGYCRCEYNYRFNRHYGLCVHNKACNFITWSNCFRLFNREEKEENEDFLIGFFACMILVFALLGLIRCRRKISKAKRIKYENCTDQVKIISDIRPVRLEHSNSILAGTEKNQYEDNLIYGVDNESQKLDFVSSNAKFDYSLKFPKDRYSTEFGNNY